MELDVLKEATIGNINQKLDKKPYNVFHFIGHGVFEDNINYFALNSKMAVLGNPMSWRSL
ncbi:MAG: hypothetical protein KI793_02100 [Rivularia sp. (in: Bacteria)]|nr:hypothetical protein [Rivularia sp. MS3]